MSAIAISYPLDHPAAPAPRQTTFGLDYATHTERSPFSLKPQTQDWGGRVWMLEWELPPMNPALMGPWLAFRSKLRGKGGYFRAGDFDRRTPLIGAGNVGTPLVNGAGQTGNGLAVDGLPLSTSGLWQPGEHIQVGDYLHMIVAPVASNGAGEATIQIEPDLWTSPADNLAIVYSSPKGLFQMIDNGARWTTDALKIGGLRLQAMMYR